MSVCICLDCNEAKYPEESKTLTYLVKDTQRAKNASDSYLPSLRKGSHKRNLDLMSYKAMLKYST